MNWAKSLYCTATDSKTERNKDYNSRNGTTGSLNGCKPCLAAFRVPWMWVRDVRAGHRVRKMQCVPLCLSLWAVPLSWTTSNDELYRLHLFLFLSLSGEALLPLTVCLQGAGTKTQDPHCEPLLHLSAVSSPQVWVLQLFSTLRHLQTLTHEIHECRQLLYCRTKRVMPSLYWKFWNKTTHSQVWQKIYCCNTVCSCKCNVKEM